MLHNAVNDTEISGYSHRRKHAVIKEKCSDYLCVSHPKSVEREVKEQGETVTMKNCENNPITL